MRESRSVAAISQESNETDPSSESNGVAGGAQASPRSRAIVEGMTGRGSTSRGSSNSNSPTNSASGSAGSVSGAVAAAAEGAARLEKRQIKLRLLTPSEGGRGSEKTADPAALGAPAPAAVENPQEARHNYSGEEEEDARGEVIDAMKEEEEDAPRAERPSSLATDGKGAAVAQLAEGQEEANAGKAGGDAGGNGPTTMGVSTPNVASSTGSGSGSGDGEDVAAIGADGSVGSASGAGEVDDGDSFSR